MKLVKRPIHWPQKIIVEILEWEEELSKEEAKEKMNMHILSIVSGF